jgi:hypothetical protein
MDFYENSDISNSAYFFFGQIPTTGWTTTFVGSQLASLKNGSGTTRSLFITAHDPSAAGGSQIAPADTSITVEANTNRVGINTGTTALSHTLQVNGDGQFSGQVHGVTAGTASTDAANVGQLPVSVILYRIDANGDGNQAAWVASQNATTTRLDLTAVGSAGVGAGTLNFSIIDVTASAVVCAVTGVACTFTGFLPNACAGSIVAGHEITISRSKVGLCSEPDASVALSYTTP